MSTSLTADLSRITSPLANIRISLNSRQVPYGFISEYQDGTKITELNSFRADHNDERDFTLSDNESIVLVFVNGKWTNRANVLGVQFMTNTGRVSPIFGESSGYILDFFRGCHGSGASPLVGLSRLTFPEPGSDQTLIGLRCEWSLNKTVESRYFNASAWFGASGDRIYNMLSSIGDPTTAQLSSIKVWSRSKINGLQFIYTDGTQSDRIGSSDGTEDRFTLNTGETITRIETRTSSGIQGLTFVTNQRASKHYGNYSGTAETIRPESSDVQHMSLLALTGSTWEGNLCGIQAIWTATDPVSSTLMIDDIVQPSALQKSPVTVFSYEGNVINNGEGTIKKTMEWKYTTTKSTTVTVNEWGSNKKSQKTTIKLSAKAKVGTFLAGAELGAELSAATVLEAADGVSFTNSEAITSTRENVIKDEVEVPPGTAVRGVATWTQYTAEDVIWHGTIIHKYADGKTKEVKVSGTFSGTNASKATTRYDKMAVEELKK